MAAWAGNESVVSVLLSAGANAKAETTAEDEGIPAGSTPLSVASQKGHSEVVAALVGAGATPAATGEKSGDGGAVPGPSPRASRGPA